MDNALIQVCSEAIERSLNVCTHGTVEIKIIRGNEIKILESHEYTVDPVTGTVTFKDTTYDLHQG